VVARAVAFGEEHELHGRHDNHAERRFGALAIANTASGTQVEIAIEAAYRAYGELEARDRMVDARAIAYRSHVVGHAATALTAGTVQSSLLSDGS
jgi:hypothetical protein